MKFENYLSLKYLSNSSGNKEISRSSITVVIVTTLSIIFYISCVGLMNGYSDGILDLNREIKTGHIDFEDYYDTYTEVSDEARQKLLNIDGISSAIFFKEVKGLLTANSINIGILSFRAYEENIFNDDQKINKMIRLLEGSKDLANNNIMLSKKTASDLKVAIGDPVFFMGMLSGNSSKVTFKKFTVSGIFTTGFVELDEIITFVGLKSTNLLFDKSVRMKISIKLEDLSKTDQIVDEVKLAGFPSLSIWKDMNASDIIANTFNKNIIGFIVTLVVIMAILNLLTAAYISINEKKKELGILKAMGFSSQKILVTQLLKGVYTGAISGLTGSILGLAVSFNLDSILKFFTNQINHYNLLCYHIATKFNDTLIMPERIEIFSKDFYLDKIYSNLSFSELIFIIIITVTFSLISSIAPAISAGNLKPNEVIRNG